MWWVFFVACESLILCSKSDKYHFQGKDGNVEKEKKKVCNLNYKNTDGVIMCSYFLNISSMNQPFLNLFKSLHKENKFRDFFLIKSNC